ncbi:uncharacterized protein PFL1_01694 [Pseudozyma flocculosa PF-1]|uniref:uncharacterized protein n=1 Tax=Pseudozyma flocculosa PF-1 TaxID=1277687 RepID=UPI0004560F62|nr:uncharacterized protein PFL1_01694 [Pseudozyma flocculosa PF-1]EPQ30793.1 hypothetical protein PFL1_01694 [Pseudozyma flocculosa PF-1]
MVKQSTSQTTKICAAERCRLTSQHLSVTRDNGPERVAEAPAVREWMWDGKVKAQGPSSVGASYRSNEPERGDCWGTQEAGESTAGTEARSQRKESQAEVVVAGPSARSPVRSLILSSSPHFTRPLSMSSTGGRVDGWTMAEPARSGAALVRACWMSFLAPARVKPAALPGLSRRVHKVASRSGDGHLDATLQAVEGIERESKDR